MLAFLRPAPPGYDIPAWSALPFQERVKQVCGSWALQGYGTPWPIYVVYLLKVFVYVSMWAFFCSFSDLGAIENIHRWWSHPIAFQKAVLWSIVFEALGLGCGSGPLTGRYFPPIGGGLYFLRPGTTKLPFFPGFPLLGGVRRTLLDVVLYAANLGFLLRSLFAPVITPELLWPMLVLLPLLGLSDKTTFLAARGEHYFVVVVCFALGGVGGQPLNPEWIMGSKLVWAFVWFWAAFSKLNHHFPSVVAVMISNSPVTRVLPIRRYMYRNYPEDLRPSRAAEVMAHMGTALELSFAPVLLLAGGGTVTMVALAVMLSFHIFITSHVPMGVPIEWNVMMVYGAFFLFGANAGVSAFGISSVLLVVFLLAVLFVLPVVGNLFPHLVSFLCSMRYYAGNWAYSIWLFRGNSSGRLDECLTKSAPGVPDQLRRFYDEDTVTAVMSKVVAFRVMHLHGRALQVLLPKAIGSFANLRDYEYLDGELVAGVVLGWNFGDGHLHGEQLLASVQKQCRFAPGELRCIFVESQPLGRPHLEYRIADAADGLLARGRVPVADLLHRQPWPE